MSEETKFQQYSSSRMSMRLITDEGKKVNFCNYTFMTTDQDVIDYLDREKEVALRNIIVKGEMVSAKEADPMEALKKKWIAEHEEQKKEEAAAKAKGELADMGNSKSTEELLSALKPAASNQVAN